LNDAALALLWRFNLSPLSEISFNIKTTNCNSHNCVYSPYYFRLSAKNRRTFALPKIRLYAILFISPGGEKFWRFNFFFVIILPLPQQEQIFIVRPAWAQSNG